MRNRNSQAPGCARDLDGAWDDIHAAYLDHKILLFRGQNLSARQFHDFGECFGNNRFSAETPRAAGHDRFRCTKCVKPLSESEVLDEGGVGDDADRAVTGSLQ
ncbi:MAG TPA: hypothetical protein EYQ60_01050 [Myxococcales bacterium]|nr:hypothetical protein [Myxococcales bacterium]